MKTSHSVVHPLVMTVMMSASADEVATLCRAKRERGTS